MLTQGRTSLFCDEAQRAFAAESAPVNVANLAMSADVRPPENRRAGVYADPQLYSRLQVDKTIERQ